MEDKLVEYKYDIPPKKSELKKEIVAFLNTDGGEILLGVDDGGNVDVKLIEQKRKDWEELLANWIITAFVPSTINLIEIYPNEIPFRIKIKPGNNRPYYYVDGEGFNSKGVYIRVGSTKRLASYEEIRRMMISNDSLQYESFLSSNQQLTFNYLASKFRDVDEKFDKNALSLNDFNNKFNNAALLLSDQCPIVSKLAVYQGKETNTFLNKTEFSGWIVKQLDDMLYIASLSNYKKVILVEKPQREEFFDIPPKALREVIINCFCHRDYSLSGEIIIEYYNDRVEIISPGGLFDGLTFENIKEGLRSKRNKIIMEVFQKIKIVENYSSGIRRVFSEYKDFDKQPLFNVSNNIFKVTLFNRNYYYDVDLVQKIN